MLFHQLLLRGMENLSSVITRGLRENLVIFKIAMINDSVIGFGRLIFHNSKERPDVINSPTGWWIMGVVVTKKYRGNGVGKQIFGHLESETMRLGGSELYSFINADNLVSKSLHHKLGFDEIAKGSSFLNVKFELLFFNYLFQRHPRRRLEFFGGHPAFSRFIFLAFQK